MIGEAIRGCETVKAVASLLSGLRNSFGDEIVLGLDPVEDLRILAVLVSETGSELCKGFKTPSAVLAAVHDPERARSVILSMLPGFVLAAKFDLGTHIPKVPNPVVSTPAIFETALARPGAIPFLCGDLETARRRVGSSAGNAGRARSARFLRFRVRYDGEGGSLGEILARSEGFRDGLVRSGWPPEILEAAANEIRESLKGPGRIDRVDPATKTVFFPTADGGYHLVSPVEAVPLWFELRTRIARDRQREGPDRRTYPIRLRPIGGSKPQNIAVEASDASGRLELLQSLPPRFKPIPVFDRILHRLTTRGTSIVPLRPAEAILRRLRALSTVDHSNRDIRDGQERVVVRLAQAYFDGPLQLSRAVALGFSIKPDRFRDPVERALVLDGFDSLNRAGIADLVGRLGGFIASFAEGDGDRLRVFAGDAASDLLRDGLSGAFDPGDEVGSEEDSPSAVSGLNEAEVELAVLPADPPKADGADPRGSRPARRSRRGA